MNYDQQQQRNNPLPFRQISQNLEYPLIDFRPPLTILWSEQDNKIHLMDLPVTDSVLYVYLLKRLLGLTVEQAPNNCKVIKHFSSAEVYEYISVRIHRAVIKFTKQSKGKENIGRLTRKLILKKAFKSVCWAIYHNEIRNGDLDIYYYSMRGFSNWSRLKLSPLFLKFSTEQSSKHYYPWMFVIQKAIKQIKETNSDLEHFTSNDLKTCTEYLRSWFSHPHHSALFDWLLTFLFKDFCSDSKRLFLFIQGETHTGKSTFLRNLIPQKWFDVKHLSNDYFTSERKGDHYLNALIFEDIGSLTRQTSLGSEFFLRLGNGGTENQTSIFNTKYGFTSFNKAQILFSTNFNCNVIFKHTAEAMNTRLATLLFDHEKPFPFILPTKELFKFKFPISINNPFLIPSPSESQMLYEHVQGINPNINHPPNITQPFYESPLQQQQQCYHEQNEQIQHQQYVQYEELRQRQENQVHYFSPQQHQYQVYSPSLIADRIQISPYQNRALYSPSGFHREQGGNIAINQYVQRRPIPIPDNRIIFPNIMRDPRNPTNIGEFLNISDSLSDQSEKNVDHSIILEKRNNRLKSSYFSEDVVFFLMWKTILEIFVDFFRNESDDALRYYFNGNLPFARYLLNPGVEGGIIEALIEIDPAELMALKENALY